MLEGSPSSKRRDPSPARSHRRLSSLSFIPQRQRNTRLPILSRASETRPPGKSSGEATPKNNNTGFDLDVIFHTASGSRSRRRAKMDTGAEENIITVQAISDLGVEITKYSGSPLQPLGPLFRPDGEITLSWNVLGRSKIYKTRFVVVPDSMAGHFDVLIGESWIVENEALKRNSDVCN